MSKYSCYIVAKLLSASLGILQSGGKYLLISLKACLNYFQLVIANIRCYLSLLRRMWGLQPTDCRELLKCKYLSWHSASTSVLPSTRAINNIGKILWQELSTQLFIKLFTLYVVGWYTITTICDTPCRHKHSEIDKY